MADTENTLILETTQGPVTIEMRPDLAPGHVARIKELEHQGYEFEAAEASFDLLVKKALGVYRPKFERLSYRVNIETDKRRRVVLEERLCRLTVGRLNDRVAVSSEVTGDDVADNQLVVNDENGAHACIVAAGRWLRLGVGSVKKHVRNRVVR